MTEQKLVLETKTPSVHGTNVHRSEYSYQEIERSDSKSPFRRDYHEPYIRPGTNKS